MYVNISLNAHPFAKPARYERASAARPPPIKSDDSTTEAWRARPGIPIPTPLASARAPAYSQYYMI